MTKISNIAKGFLGSTPDEDWYFDRKSKCDPCEFNVINIEDLELEMDKLELSLVQKSTRRVAKKTNQGMCNLCGCFTDKKIKVAGEKCPNNPPKWDSVSTQVSKNKSLTYTLISPYNATTSMANGIYTIFTEYDQEKSLDFEFQIKGNPRFQVLSVKAGCQCTVSEVEKGTGQAKIKLKISTVSFTGSLTSKSVDVSYRVGNRRQTAKVKINMKKNGLQ